METPHAAGLDDTSSSSSSAWSLPLPSLSPHDSAVSEAVPSLNSPSRTKYDAEDPVPDSGVCFAPIDTEPGAAFGLLPPLELPPPMQEPQPSRWQDDDDGDDDPFSSPSDLALPHSSADPSSNANAIAGTADAPPVGSFHTLAPLMRAGAPAFPAVVRAYARLLGFLVVSFVCFHYCPCLLCSLRFASLNINN